MSQIRAVEGLGVYIHFPWCLTKCPYCDFLSVAVPNPGGSGPLDAEGARRWIPHKRYADGVLRELEARLPFLSEPLPPLRSVFFGGGTPSLWDPRQVSRVLRRVRELLGGPTESIEVTIECNPTSFDPAHAEALLEAGINRVSIGVQNLNTQRLRFLGRLHDDVGGLRAVKEAVQAGVPRVSADLIYGIHNQAPSDALSDIDTLLETGITHLSAYTLTIEPGTRFGALDREGKLPLLEDDLVANSYEAVSAHLTSKGFRHYEVSNFAHPGAESIHNTGYWQGRDYLGLGTGAFGTVTTDAGRLRYKNLLSPERYMDVWTGAPVEKPFSEHLSEREEISADISHEEALLLGLRTEDGVDLAEITELRGADPKARDRGPTIEKLLGAGKLRQEGTRLTIPRKHWLVADGIIRELL